MMGLENVGKALGLWLATTAFPLLVATPLSGDMFLKTFLGETQCVTSSPLAIASLFVCVCLCECVYVRLCVCVCVFLSVYLAGGSHETV